ncbi:MAG TPA: YncE family protein [Bryobacteraceae bacterium]|nr:YncE family protein [Bryobacteraceae bacterium]
MPAVSRRAWLLASAAALGCGSRKGTRYPGYAFVANAGGSSVTAVDLSAFSPAREFALEAPPTAVLAHPARPFVYVLSAAEGVLHEFDARCLRPARKLRLGAPAISMRLAPDGRALWVLAARELTRIPLDRFQPAGRIPLPAEANDFDLSSDRRAAVCFSRDRLAALASLERLRVERTFTAGPDPGIIRFRPDGRQVLVGNRGNHTLTIAETASGRVAVHLPLPLEPRNFCYDPSLGQLFISGPGMDAVVIVFPYLTEVEQTILAGRAPGAMTVSSNPAYLFVANPETATVTVLDIETRKLVAVVSVGAQPHFLLVTPDNEYLLAVNRRSGSLAVVHIPALGVRRYKQSMVAPLFTMIPVGQDPVGAAVVTVG